MPVKKIIFLALFLAWNNIAEARSFSFLGGFDAGGVVLGANLDINETPTDSYGGYLRIFSKDEEEGVPSIVAFGGHIKAVLKSGNYRFYFAPGAGVIDVDRPEDSELLIGPTLNIGITMEIDKKFTAGVENTKLYSWFGDTKGLIKDALLAQISFEI